MQLPWLDYPGPVFSWGGQPWKRGHTYPDTEGLEKANCVRVGIASTGLQALGTSDLEEHAQGSHVRGGTVYQAWHPRASMTLGI